MHQIKSTFDKRFQRWGITLPDIVDQHQTGTIQQEGWTINYHFVEADEQLYFEYYATHRMTNDTLNRIYSDGRHEIVASCQEFSLADDPEAEEAYIQHNRKFYAKVKSLGLI